MPGVEDVFRDRRLPAAEGVLSVVVEPSRQNKAPVRLDWLPQENWEVVAQGFSFIVCPSPHGCSD